MCCVLYIDVITLFVIINTIPPKFRPSKSYFPHNYSTNTTLQGEEHGYHNSEDEVLNDPMD